MTKRKSVAKKLEDLPGEILVHIFKKLDMESLNNCLQVSKRWRAAISSGVGLRRNFGWRTGFITSEILYRGNEVFFPSETVGEIGVKSCVLSDIESSDLEVGFKHGFLLKELTVVGEISGVNFSLLVNPILINLTTFRIHILALNGFSLQNARMTLDFPNLKELTVMTTGLYNPTGFSGIDNAGVLANNLIQIMTCCDFPKLLRTHLYGLPMITSSKPAILRAVLYFISRHRKSLKHLSLMMCPSEEKPDFVLSDNIPHVQGTDLKDLQLETIELLLKCTDDVGLDSILGELAKDQKSLTRYVNLGNPTFTLSPILVQNNIEYLAELELKIPSWNITILDMSIFRNCSSLKYMSLCGEPVTGQRGRLINTRHIPICMQSLRFFNLYINTEDAYALVVREWEGLKILELQGIGTRGDHGIPFFAICELLSLRRIYNFYVYDGINRASLQITTYFHRDSFPVQIRQEMGRMRGLYYYSSVRYENLLGLPQVNINTDYDRRKGFFTHRGTLTLGIVRHYLLRNPPEWKFDVNHRVKKF